MLEIDMEDQVKREAMAATVSTTVLMASPTPIAGRSTPTPCGAGSTFSDSTAKHGFRQAPVAITAFHIEGIRSAFAPLTFAAGDGKVPEANCRAVSTAVKDER